jgi:hypothetical protein
MHTPIALEMEQEREARPSRIHLPYRDVHKFLHDESNASKIPKMLQKFRYKKQPKYYGTQVMYEGSKPMWYAQVYIFTPKPLRGIFEVEKIYVAIAPRRTFYVEIRDAVH